MKPDRKSCPDWPMQHPWLYVYTVITTMLGGFLALVYLMDYLKGALP